MLTLDDLCRGAERQTAKKASQVTGRDAARGDKVVPHAPSLNKTDADRAAALGR